MAGGSRASAAAESNMSTFGEAFFVSRRNDGSIELLGSAVTWLLLLLSMCSIGLMAHLALANRKDTMHPVELSRSIRTNIKKQKFQAAINNAKNNPSYLGIILTAAFKEAKFGRDVTIKMIISSDLTQKNESEYHDRFIFSERRGWNAASPYQIYGNQGVDIQKQENQETIDNDLREFEKLWDGEGAYEINGKNNDVFKKLLHYVAEEFEAQRPHAQANFNRSIEMMDATSSKLEDILLNPDKNNLKD